MLSALILSFTLALPQQAPTPQEPPAQIEWQRSLADALAAQQALRKPLLLVLNIDGETFCEQFANRTYRDAKFVATTRGYVCLIASGERHTDSDYDGQGRRIECPRFGGCTCSEHINNGVLLFQKYFQGESAAPRHYGLSLDGKILFDRFLDSSMKTAIDAIAQNGAKDADAALPTEPAALLARRDAAARLALEQRYRAGDTAARVALLTAAAKATSEPFDLLRIGLRSADEAEFRAAATALAQVATKDALIDLEDALARCDDDATRTALDAALDRLATSDAGARLFAEQRRAVLGGLAKASSAPFRAGLQKALPPLDRDAAEQALDAAEAAAKKDRKDASLLLATAFANLELARALPAGSQNANLMREDARRIAEEARKLAKGEEQLHHTAAVLAITLDAAGDTAKARTYAQEGLQCLASTGAIACTAWVCDLLRAAARSAAAAAYAKAQKDPNASAAADLADAAYAFALLVEHHAATEADLREAAACLAFGGARREAQTMLMAALPRFPGSNDIHADYRNRIAIDRGAAGLCAAYQTYLNGVCSRSGDTSIPRWFGGYAFLVAAEMFVKDHDARAKDSYQQSITLFANSAATNPGIADSANHFAVFAHTGLALLLHQAGDSKDATAHLLAARALRPASMTETDGLGRKPQAVLERIAKELAAAGKQDLADPLTKPQ